MNENTHDRQDEETPQEEFGLTAAEKKALEELPRDRLPSPALEDRLVGLLRERGFLKPPRRRVVELTGWRIAAAAAACAVLLATGFLLGQWVGSQQVAGGDTILRGGRDLSVAASLQQAGSAYLLALERLASLPDSIDAQQTAQGREVAIATLCSATDQVSRLVPKSVVTERLLATLDTEPDTWAAEGPGEVTIESNRVIEF